MMINELIEQIGGRERLENIASGNAFYCIQDDEGQLMARAMLAVLDAKPVAYTHASEISNMHVTGLYIRGFPIDRRLNAEEGYTVPLYTIETAASAPEGWKLVPAEPTQRMIDAHTEGMVSGGATRAYRDMLAAAPAAGGDGG
ncbi:hypothetical protein PQB85_gp41 [Erwinia phage Midgardsormr38]|uniref:Uncharacterized protein n=1 Tax=Erwinia phage Midgardsormr38 TaxID=2663326 RepID=A0A5Q2F5H4_9CAUD|nr:hypothetical protein PQB85_gp41 [Erwinia phage Midgardsormr38]QGF21998.1 hypothetical protein [Erwinia phage Midgardsormr38]